MLPHLENCEMALQLRNNITAAEALRDHIDGTFEPTRDVTNMNRSLYMKIVQENNRLRVENEKYKNWVDSQLEFILQLETDLLAKEKEIAGVKSENNALYNKLERMTRRLTNLPDKKVDISTNVGPESASVSGAINDELPQIRAPTTTVNTNVTGRVISGSSTSKRKPYVTAARKVKTVEQQMCINLQKKYTKKRNIAYQLYKRKPFAYTKIERQRLRGGRPSGGSKKKQIKETTKSHATPKNLLAPLKVEIDLDKPHSPKTKGIQDAAATKDSVTREKHGSEDQLQADIHDIYRNIKDSVRHQSCAAVTPVTASQLKECSSVDKSSNLHENIPTKTSQLHVPTFRIVPLPNLYSMEGTEHIGEGYEVIERRHKKYEEDEKKRKRWDLQRQREMSRERKEDATSEEMGVTEKPPTETIEADVNCIEMLVVSGDVPISVWGTCVRNAALPNAPSFYNLKSEVKRVKKLKQ